MNKAVAILGGGLYKNNNGTWRTTGFSEGDDFSVDGSSIRVIAGYYLHKLDPSFLIITSGGKGQYINISDAPTLSSVIKNELIKLGVPIKKIVEESKSNNTYQQLQELHKIIIKNNINELFIISNSYHLPRIIAMLDNNVFSKKIISKNIIKLLSAEEIAINHNPKKWKKEINEAYKSKSIKKRIELEEKGVEDIKNGVYKLV